MTNSSSRENKLMSWWGLIEHFAVDDFSTCREHWLQWLKAFKKETSDDKHTQEIKWQDDDTRTNELIDPLGRKFVEQSPGSWRWKKRNGRIGWYHIPLSIP